RPAPTPLTPTAAPYGTRPDLGQARPPSGHIGQRGTSCQRHALARRLLWCAPCLRYAGGMVLRFTAKVKKREVVVRGVDLPDGSTVDVTIDPHEEDDFVLTPEDLAAIDESVREIRRGELVTGDELLASLR